MIAVTTSAKETKNGRCGQNIGYCNGQWLVLTVD